MREAAVTMRDRRCGGRPSFVAPVCPWIARLVVPVVLAGLWMMHGVSATTAAGCHGGMMPMPVAGPMTLMASPVVHATGESTSLTPGHAQAAAMGAGEQCLSDQPPGPGGASPAWLTSAASAGVVLLDPAMKTWWGRGDRAPPWLTGGDLLTMVCVART